jgi:hypothetical protein
VFNARRRRHGVIAFHKFFPSVLFSIFRQFPNAFFPVAEISPNFLRALAASSGAGMQRYRFVRIAVCCPVM